ncbi:pentapeptide repeat-containing protein [Vibrio parahaemolyticus]|nr:pentapeptide repeat-containing protein [Vibrio parahaemolyticus]ELA7318770.1 pentapeptide repeat-containing protein [Vibrio parahaemolyticus]HCG8562575.1 pentapeptide repeat-containing protein [Vibrio parahaemolyticus]
MKSIASYQIKFKVLFTLTCSCIFATACNSDNTSTEIQSKLLVEKDFANNSRLRANPEQGTVILFLEPPYATVAADDFNGESGSDVIPYRYSRSLYHTFCYEDDNSNSKHSTVLNDSSGAEVLRISANEECVSAVIPEGEYHLVLTHGQHVDSTDITFLVTTPDSGSQTEINSINYSITSRVLRSIGSLLINSAYADAADNNVTTLISTNACKDCDLSGADLSSATLTFADLSGADLSDAILTNVDLFESTLTGTNFSGADLSNGDFRSSEMAYTDLSNANLSGAYFSNAHLSPSNLNHATVIDTNFDYANLVGATWIDGGICDITSVGFCNSTDGGDATLCDSLQQGTSDDGNIIYKCLLPTVDKEVCTTELGGPDGGTLITSCEAKDASELVTSVDLVDIFDQASSSFSVTLDNDTPMAILAWGGEGGIGSSGGLWTSGGDGGKGGFASTVTTLSDFLDNYGQTSFIFYIGENGTLSNEYGDGGSSTLVMTVESSPTSLEDDVVLIAGGGGGGESSSFFVDGTDGSMGGIAASSIMGQGTIGVGQSFTDGASGGSSNEWGDGGNGADSGKDGIGGQGGQGFLGRNSEWVNGDPVVGSDGRGGNADDSFSAGGGGGGGGGYGGGGAGDGGAGAGGGSWSIIPTITCNSAPTEDTMPSSPGSSGDDYGSKNGAVEVWIFPNGC